MIMRNLFPDRSTPVILQAETAECGLACLAMVASHHGHRIDLATLRARHATSLKGTTLADLMRVAGSLRLAPRALRLGAECVGSLKLPCLLHWDRNHFVVLTRVIGERFTLHDPAVGARSLPLQALSTHFTGVALELTPTDEFVARTERRTMRLTSLVGDVSGVGRQLAKALTLALVLQLAAVLGPFYMQWVVDGALASANPDLLEALAIGFLLLALVQTGVTAARALVLMNLGTVLNVQLLSKVFGHLVRLPMAWFEKRHMGDVVSRFESLGAIQRTLTTSFLEALIDGVMAVAVLAMMIAYSAKLAFVGIVAASLYGALRIALYRPLQVATEEELVRSARQESHFLETVRGMQTIKLLVGEDRRAATWQRLVLDHFRAVTRVQRLSVLYQASSGLLFGVENVATIWIGALLVLDPDRSSVFSVGMLFAFIAYKTQFVQRIAGLVEKGLELRMLKLHAERVGDITLAAMEPRDGLLALPAAAIVPSIELKGVSFRYADGEPWVLENVNLSIAAGESVAIVGPSGCGKTTLVKLMLGLLRPNEGSIEIGGAPLGSIGIARYRLQVAGVMQEDQLLSGSLAENIGFFDTQPDQSRIEHCARLAAIHDDIVAMPMQYDTLVGDMGTVLSGGQKQRILLARALYRQPRMLFLDEATSDLDVARERSVSEAVRALKLTRVIVAHRPETVATADRVIEIGRLQGEWTRMGRRSQLEVPSVGDARA